MEFLLLLAFVVLSQASINVEWEMFKKSHGKSYQDSAEELYRREIFLQNKLTIDQHNEDYHRGLVTFHMKMNRFGDLAPEEIRAMMNRYNATSQPRTVSGSAYIGADNVQLPDSVDWRELGAVTPVKDQGKCGSCWAFSTTGALEGQNFKKNGKLVSLSEQNLVDCSNSYGNQGCNGGIPAQAFQYVKDNGGIDSEDDYPYEGVDGSCRFRLSSVGAMVTDYIQIPQGNEAALQQALATVGPVSVAIDAGLTDFHFYSGGVYYSQLCSNQRLDHAVLAVGYGSEDGQDYWLVKNSWNSGWGEQGYIKMARNKSNNCGIATQATYPLV